MPGSQDKVKSLAASADTTSAGAGLTSALDMHQDHQKYRKNKMKSMLLNNGSVMVLFH